MTREDDFTLKEFQMLKACTEWYHAYGTRAKGNATYDYSDISARIGQKVNFNDFAQLVKKLDFQINIEL